MNQPGRTPAELLHHLLDSFPNERIPPVEVISGTQLPEPFRSLLDHEFHMTVTVESHFNEPVRVRVLSEYCGGPYYSRILNLVGEKTGKTLLFGVMRIRLDFLPLGAKQEILARREPLGRILIRHNILRKLELIALLKIQDFPGREHWFGNADGFPYFGRLARIHVENQPAVEVFEVVTPNATPATV